MGSVHKIFLIICLVHHTTCFFNDIKNGFEDIGDAVEDAFDDVRDGVEDLVEDTVKTYKKVENTIEDTVEDVKEFVDEEIYQETKKAVQKLSNITDIDFNKVLDIVVDVLSDLDEFVSYKLCSGVCKVTVKVYTAGLGGDLGMCSLVCDFVVRSIYKQLEKAKKGSSAPAFNNDCNMSVTSLICKAMGKCDVKTKELLYKSSPKKSALKIGEERQLSVQERNSGIHSAQLTNSTLVVLLTMMAIIRLSI